jgi:hypothetical protein
MGVCIWAYAYGRIRVRLLHFLQKINQSSRTNDKCFYFFLTHFRSSHLPLSRAYINNVLIEKKIFICITAFICYLIILINISTVKYEENTEE